MAPPENVPSVLGVGRGEGGSITERPHAHNPHRRRFPLSFGQQRLWLLDQFAPGTSAYNVARAIRISGALSGEALQGALDEIVRRHESLRTSFAVVGQGRTRFEQ